MLSYVSASALGRLISVVCLYVQIPIAIRYLGKETFGLWVTFTSVISFFSIGDLGIGLALQNAVSEALGKRALEKIRPLFIAAVLVVSAAALVIAFIGIASAMAVWKFGLLHANLHKDGVIALCLMISLFCANMPLTCAQRLAVGLQQGWITAVCAVVVNISTVILIYGAAKVHAKAIAFFSIPLAAQIAGNVLNCVLVLPRVPRVALSFGLLRSMSRSMLRRGVLFIVPQLTGVALYSVMPIAIAATLTLAEVAKYNILTRLAYIPNQGISMLTMSLWPAYAEAHARRDYAWIAKAFRTSQILAFSVALFAFIGLLGFGERAAKLLAADSEYSVSLTQMLAASVFASVICITPGLAALLNGVNQLRAGAIVGVATSIAILFIVYPAVLMGRVGGAFWAQSIAYVGVGIPLSAVFIGRYKRQCTLNV